MDSRRHHLLSKHTRLHKNVVSRSLQLIVPQNKLTSQGIGVEYGPIDDFNAVSGQPLFLPHVIVMNTVLDTPTAFALHLGDISVQSWRTVAGRTENSSTNRHNIWLLWIHTSNPSYFTTRIKAITWYPCQANDKEYLVASPPNT
jgi:hypothetical protein